VDNSINEGFFDELKKEKDFVVVRDEVSAAKPAERLVSSRNKVLDYAIEISTIMFLFWMQMLFVRGRLLKN
jgi:hypothetical protein